MNEHGTNEHRTNENSGIFITGNARVQADAMAAGTRAQAHSRKIDNRRYGEVRARLDALLEEMRADEAGHPELREAIETGEAIAGELAADEPEPRRLVRLLRSLGTGVEKFSTFAAAVASIEESVRALL
ncbi:hypothetical protein [Nonomuraea sp. NPDC050783]|uniref:hypothetical protein n=1 Tax=Nonomuraea sp. NPDC050783 TaxID=3154634 RepID=UPI00346693F4